MEQHFVESNSWHSEKQRRHFVENTLFVEEDHLVVHLNFSAIAFPEKSILALLQLLVRCLLVRRQYRPVFPKHVHRFHAAWRWFLRSGKKRGNAGVSWWKLFLVQWWRVASITKWGDILPYEQPSVAKALYIIIYIYIQSYIYITHMNIYIYIYIYSLNYIELLECLRTRLQLSWPMYVRWLLWQELASSCLVWHDAGPKKMCAFFLGKINGGECLSMAVVCGATFSLGKECHFRLRKAKKWQKTMTINQAVPKKIVPRLHYIALFGN